MRRWIFNIASGLSLVLCLMLPVMSLWAQLRSQHAIGFRINTYGKVWHALSLTGDSVELAQYRYHPTLPCPVSPAIRGYSPSPGVLAWLHTFPGFERRRLGFAFIRRPVITIDAHQTYGLSGWHWQVDIPYGFLALVFAAMPTYCLLLIRRGRRRAQRGLCPHCGYDLRASRERCPECGEPISMTMLKS